MLWLLLACTAAPGPGPGIASDSGGEVGDSGGEGDTWRSALYPEDWTPGSGEGEWRLPDLSYAGYRNGEVPPPEVDELGDHEVFDVSDQGADPTGEADSTLAVQAAIDAAEAAGGGLVWLPEGLYRLDGLLEVTASGVVLAGAGPEATRLFFTEGTGMSDRHHLSFTGVLAEGEDLPLRADGAAFDDTVLLDASDAAGLTPGDAVSVGWVITEDFVAEHAMEGIWQVSNGEWRPFFRRRVLAVDDDGTVTLDVPLRYPALLRDEASLRVETGQLREVGVQDLSVSTTVSWEEAWSNDRSHAIALSGVLDAWVRRVASFESPAGLDDRGRHLQSGGVLVVHSARVSVLETELALPQHRGGGGNGYLFEVSRSSEVLFADCAADQGRHNFIQNWDFGTSGVVFLRSRSTGGRAYSDSSEGFATTGMSEFHHQLAMANLIDGGWTDDGWQAINRWAYSSGAGHTATESVFWGLDGPGSLTSYQAGRGYVVGTGTELVVETEATDLGFSYGTLPSDRTEGLGAAASLEPASLYEDQLARRLDRGEALW